MEKKMLLNYEAEVGAVSTPRTRPRATAAKTHVGQAEWTWRELRDYAVSQIEAHAGAFERVFYKEQTIFNAFLKRWPNGKEIAEYAFEVMEGKWQGKWIGVNHFTKCADPWFASIINERLRDL